LKRSTSNLFIFRSATQGKNIRKKELDFKRKTLPKDQHNMKILVLKSLNGHSVSSFQLKITQNLSKSRLGFGSNSMYTSQQEKCSGRKPCLRSVVECVSPGTFSADFTGEQTMATVILHTLGERRGLVLSNVNCNCQCSYIERFSNECRKTKTKVITPANHNKHKLPNEPIRT